MSTRPSVRRVLLVDSSQHWPSNPLFAEALEHVSGSAGWEWAVVDEAPHLTRGLRVPARVVHRVSGRRAGVRSLNRELLDTARRMRPDLVLVVKGQYLTPDTLAEVRRASGATLVNYATDDPFNPRVSSPELRAAIGTYDVYACTKRAVLADASRAGARSVAYVPFAYKPSVHFPEAATGPAEHDRFAADVAFIGGADDDRLPYLEHLLDRLPEVNLALWGGFWGKYPKLRPHWRGVALGREYRLAISGAHVLVNLVRRANRDGHVMRSFEVPACGGCMVSERTDEHEQLFADGRETRFFSTPDDLVELTAELLGDPPARAGLADQARRWATSGGHTYADRIREIVAIAEGSRRDGARS
jgi:hypothetical protein